MDDNNKIHDRVSNLPMKVTLLFSSTPTSGCAEEPFWLCCSSVLRLPLRRPAWTRRQLISFEASLVSWTRRDGLGFLERWRTWNLQDNFWIDMRWRSKMKTRFNITLPQNCNIIWYPHPLRGSLENFCFSRLAGICDSFLYLLSQLLTFKLLGILSEHFYSMVRNGRVFV